MCALLAAGSARRMGGNKPSLEIGGRSLLEYALDACGSLPVAVVIPSALEAFARALLANRADDATIVVNDRPELGMSHSLRVANVALARPHASLAVIPSDLPFLRAAHVREMFDAARAANAEIVFPRRGDGTPGHPVVFAPRARAAIERLAHGDTIRLLRDDPAFERAIVERNDDAYFFDVDTPDALARASARLHARREV